MIYTKFGIKQHNLATLVGWTGKEKKQEEKYASQIILFLFRLFFLNDLLLF